MAKRAPFEIDVSVSAAKRRARKARGTTGEAAVGQRGCEWPGCEAAGKYRAPRSRDALHDYVWFCLDHVREYNKQWNYYDNMSEDEIGESQESDRLWGRTTWELGKNPGYFGTTGPHQDGDAWRRFGFSDPLEALGENATLNPGATAGDGPRRERRLPAATRKALEIMGLEDTVTKADIRARYKELVKRYHPDLNGGDRSEETRLREVLNAWDQLRDNAAFKD